MKVALLTNFIPPYRKSLYQLIARRVDHFKVYLSTAMESDRNWQVNHDGLNVEIQKTLSYQKEWKHENGYNQFVDIHIPYDTVYRLFKFRPDVVISVELGIRSLLSSIYCSLFGKQLILWLALSEHTEKNKKGLRIKLRKYLLGKSSAILCNGESSKNYVRGLGIEKPFYFVACSSDYEIKDPKTNFNSDKKQFLYTGRLINLKGISQMIDEVSNWATKNKEDKIELIIAGDGPEKSHFSKLDAFSNVSYNLLGDVKYEELNEWYSKVDYYLFPTLGDEWGVVVNEALLSGIPVLGSIYSQAVLELIEDDKNGWQYDPLKKGDLERLLTTAVGTTNEQLEKMSVYGLEVVKEVTPEKVCSEIVSALNYARGSKES
jgi:hypothetical protein